MRTIIYLILISNFLLLASCSRPIQNTNIGNERVETLELHDTNNEAQELHLTISKWIKANSDRNIISVIRSTNGKKQTILIVSAGPAEK